MPSFVIYGRRGFKVAEVRDRKIYIRSPPRPDYDQLIAEVRGNITYTVHTVDGLKEYGHFDGSIFFKKPMSSLVKIEGEQAYSWHSSYNSWSIHIARAEGDIGDIEGAVFAGAVAVLMRSSLT